MLCGIKSVLASYEVDKEARKTSINHVHLHGASEVVSLTG